jgi:hypothetical protein
MPTEIIRKITYGNRSAKGELALARSLTVTQTRKLQQRPLLSYLLTAVHSHRRHLPAPSQLPFAFAGMRTISTGCARQRRRELSSNN